MYICLCVCLCIYFYFSHLASRYGEKITCSRDMLPGALVDRQREIMSSDLLRKFGSDILQRKKKKIKANLSQCMDLKPSNYIIRDA